MRRRRESERLKKILTPEIHDDYQRNDERYFRFRRAEKIARELESMGQWVVRIDNPDEKLETHFIHVTFTDDMIRKVSDFSTMCGLFDSMMMFASSDQEISISFMMDGIYEKGEA